MVGNINLLGHWDTNKAVFLNTTPETYPLWTIKIDLPRDKIIEYKYLIMKEFDKSKLPQRKPQIFWESLPPTINRIVDTHRKKEISIYDQMGSSETVEEYVEVQTVKRFKSTQLMEDYDLGDEPGNHRKRQKTDMRKIVVEEELVDPGYRDSDEEVTSQTYFY